MIARVPASRKTVAKIVTVGAIVGTAAVVAWLFVHAREDPPRGDRGPVALPTVNANDAGADAVRDSLQEGDSS